LPSGGIAQVDARAQGGGAGLPPHAFANPEGLVDLMQRSRGKMKLQPDHRLVLKADWDLPEQRLKGVRRLISDMAQLAAKGRKAD